MPPVQFVRRAYVLDNAIFNVKGAPAEKSVRTLHKEVGTMKQ